jgi:hypothetical protein
MRKMTKMKKVEREKIEAMILQKINKPSWKTTELKTICFTMVAKIRPRNSKSAD